MLNAVAETKEKMAYSIKEASEMASISVSYIRSQIKTRELKAKLVGRRVLILKEDLREYLRNKEDWKPQSEENN